ncbi:MAG: IPT/TIG domain-containing protein [Pyrinomonadaceae bacterium]|nr:IPT/TIG domain-containing protein [Sphingobacteriaceae bacterium]
MKASKKIISRAVALLFIGSLCITACKKDSESNGSTTPTAKAIDPGEAKGGEVLTITGDGLSNITSILFAKDSVPASFNPNFNTDNSILFRVPDTASGGTQDIILTNNIGKQVKVAFNVIALPSVTEVSNYNFSTGEQLTLKGNNLKDVTTVKITGTTSSATIVSQSKKQLVITLPATAINTGFLDITNSTGTITTTQEFVNREAAYKIFTDNYGDGWENASWGAASISSTEFKAGTASFKATYGKGNWSANGFATWSTGFDYSPDYKFLTFYIKGGTKDNTYYITGDQRDGGYGNGDITAPVLVPANVWTYYKIPLSTLKLWSKGTKSKQLGFYIRGPEGEDQTIHFDDILVVK